MAEELSKEQVTEQLAAAFGLEDVKEDTSDLDKFYAEAGKPAEEPEAKVEDPVEPVAAQSWVHEPTGREFDNELDYLKYNSGWTADKLGTENKELRERIEAEKAERAPQSKTPDRKELMEHLWPDLDPELYDDNVMKLMYQGLDKAAGMISTQARSELDAVKAELQALRSGVENERVRAQFGVEPSQEQKLLEKHPSLKAMAPQDRMAVMRDLLSSQQPERATTRLADKIPAQRPEDHVESSVVSGNIPDDTERAVQDKFDTMNDSEKLSVLGQMFENSGVGELLKGSFD